MGELKPVQDGSELVPQGFHHVRTGGRLECQSLYIAVQSNLLLGNLAERLYTGEEAAPRIMQDRTEPCEPVHVPLKQVQQVRLDNIVEVVSCRDLCRPDPSSCDIDRFPPEDTAVRAGGQPIFPLPKKIVKPPAILRSQVHRFFPVTCDPLVDGDCSDLCL